MLKCQDFDAATGESVTKLTQILRILETGGFQTMATTLKTTVPDLDFIHKLLSTLQRKACMLHS
jgi:hypothetical protein